MATRTATAALAVILAFTFTAHTHAQPFVWDGGHLLLDTWDAGPIVIGPPFINWDRVGANPNMLPGPAHTVQFGDGFGGAFSGTPTLNIPATVGTLQINHSSGQTILTSGTLGLATGDLTRAGAGTHEITSNIVLGADGQWDVTGTGRLDINSILSGAFDLTKTGSAILRLEGTTANTYTGLTTVSEGRLTLGKTDGIDAIIGSVTVDGTGEFRLGNGNQINDSSAVTVNAPGAQFNVNGNTETINTLNNTTGSTSVAGGSLTVTTLNGSGIINLGGGSLTVGDGSFDGNVNGTSSTITKYTNGTLEYGTSGGNFAGNVHINNGTLRLDDNSANAFDDATVNINSGGNALDITTNTVDATVGALEGDSRLDLDGQTFTAGGNDASTSFTGVLNANSSGVFNKTGTGTLTLGGGAGGNFAGTFNINDGDLVLDSNDLLDNATVNVNNAAANTSLTIGSVTNATFDGLNIGTDGGNSNTATTTIDGSGVSLTIDGTPGLTIGHATDGTATLNVHFDGIFTVAATAGSTTINPTGTLDVDNATFNALTNVTVDGGTLTVDQATFRWNLPDAPTGIDGHTLTLQNGADVDAISSTINLNGGNNADSGNNSGDGGTLNMTGGTLDIDSSSTLTLNAGSLFVDANSSGAGGQLNISGGTANLDGDVRLNGNNGAFTTAGSDPGPGTGGNAGSVTVSGTGTLNQASTGTMQIRAGRSSNDNSIDVAQPGLPGFFKVDGGTANLDGSLNLSGRVGQSGSLNIRNPSRGVNAGDLIAMSGSLTISGPVNMTGGNGGNGGSGFDGAAGGNGGDVTVSGGTLTLNNALESIDLSPGLGGTGGGVGTENGLGGTPGSVTVSGGTLQLDAGTITADNTLTPTSADPITLFNVDIDVNTTGMVRVNDDITLEDAVVTLDGTTLNAKGIDGASPTPGNDITLEGSNAAITATGSAIISLNGGNLSSLGSSAPTGNLTVNDGTLDLGSGTKLSLLHGSQGLGTGGPGGTVNINGGTALLGGMIDAQGRNGTANVTGSSGNGGKGGKLNIAGGDATLTGVLDLTGGNGGNSGQFGGPGTGAAGGNVNISDGSLTLNSSGALIDLTAGFAGDGGAQNNNSGKVTISGTGVLTLIAGTIEGNNTLTTPALVTEATTDPIHIQNVTVNINSSGGLDLDDHATVDNATLNVNVSGGLDLAANKTLTAINGSALAFDNTDNLQDTRTFNILSGSSLTMDAANFAVLNIDGATLLVDGAGSSLTTTLDEGQASWWGAGTGTASVTISNDATATVGALTLAPTSDADLLVSSGADMTSGTLTIATATDRSASLTVSGTGSTYTQTDGQLNIGSDTGDGFADLIVEDFATFTKEGTGQVNLESSAYVDINTSATFRSHRKVNIKGVVLVDNATFSTRGPDGALDTDDGSPGRTIEIDPNAFLEIGSTFDAINTSTVNLRGGDTTTSSNMTNGGDAGNFIQNDDFVSLGPDSLLDLRGGVSNSLGTDGAVGDLSLLGGEAELEGEIKMHGGSPSSDGGDGLNGGTILIDNAVAIVSGDIDQHGSDGIPITPVAIHQVGGDGGDTTITNLADVTLDTGAIFRMHGGAGVAGAPDGDRGQFTVSDGTLTINGATIAGQSTIPTLTDPINLVNADFLADDDSVVTLNGNTTISNASTVVIDAATLDGSGDNGVSPTPGITLTIDGANTTFDTLNGVLIDLTGGDNDTNEALPGATGGTLNINDGTVTLSGIGSKQLDLSGGTHTGVNARVDGADAGQINIAGGTITIDANVNMDGAHGTGLDSEGVVGTGGAGGNGGTFTMTGGTTTFDGLNKDLLLRGGHGGDDSSTGGDGGDGGFLDIQAGAHLTLDNQYTVNLSPGLGGAGTTANGADGAPGTVQVAGTLTITNGSNIIADTPLPALLASTLLVGSPTNIRSTTIDVAPGGTLELQSSLGNNIDNATINVDAATINASGANGDPAEVGRDVTLKNGAVIDLTNAALFDLRGGNNTDGQGATGGTLTLNTGSLNIDSGSQLNLSAGTTGGPGPDDGANAGQLNIAGGTATLEGTITLDGTDGIGPALPSSGSGNGGDGGALNITGGATTLTGGLLMRAGDGGVNFSDVGGDGGNGGLVDIQAGSLTLNTGALIDLSPGLGGTGSTNGSDGTPGSVNVSGTGVLTINAGTIEGNNALTGNLAANQLTVDPIHIQNTTIDVTAGGTLELDDNTTVDNATINRDDTSTVDLATTKTLTAQNSSTLDYDGNTTLGADQTYALTTNSTFRHVFGDLTLDDATLTLNNATLNIGLVLGSNTNTITLNGSAAQLDAQPGALITLNPDENTSASLKGGDVVVNDGAFTLDTLATLNMNGGKGPFHGGARDGGNGGNITVTGGTATLAGTTDMNGHDGNDGATLTSSSNGGNGGILTVNGGMATLSNTLNMTGGKGGDDDEGDTHDGGDGGAGGIINVDAGTLTLEPGASIDLTRGLGGTGAFSNNGDPGAPGQLNINGGDLVLNAGLATADNTLTPIGDTTEFVATPINLSAGSVDGVSTSTTLSHGTVFTQSGGAATFDTLTIDGDDTLVDINAGTFAVNTAINFNSGTIDGPVAGAATLTKNTTGTATLDGTTPNTYAGLTTVNSGTLELSKTVDTDAIGGDLTVNGGEARWFGGGQVPDTATVTINDGNARLTGFNEQFAHLQLNAPGAFHTGSGALTLDTIDGDGLIRFPNVTNPNSGTLNVGAGTIYGEVLQHGVINKNTTGTLTFGGNTVIDAKITFNVLDGTLVLDDPDIQSTNDSINVASGATLMGNATIAGDVNTDGTVAPGTSAGLIAAGVYSATSTAKLEIEIAGLGGPGAIDGHDQVAVTGDLTLAGELEVALIDGFEPDWGDVFTAMTYTGRTGTFDTLTGVAISPDGTKSLAVVFDDLLGEMRLTAAIPGDANLDGEVSIGDLSLLASNFNESPGLGSWRKGDFNNDGQITIGDLSLLASNFGETNATIGSALVSGGISLELAASIVGIDLSQIPEPGTLALVGLGMAGFFRSRHRSWVAADHAA